MSRKKKPQTLPELYAAKEETENELRKAKQKEKILQNQISKLTRNARTHRLCTRAGMLESFLPNPELLTNEEVMAVLKIAFHQPGMKGIMEKLAAESEARSPLRSKGATIHRLRRCAAFSEGSCAECRCFSAATAAPNHYRGSCTSPALTLSATPLRTCRP